MAAVVVRGVRHMVIMAVMVMMFPQSDRRRELSDGPLELVPCTGRRRWFGSDRWPLLGQ